MGFLKRHPGTKTINCCRGRNRFVFEGTLILQNKLWGRVCLGVNRSRCGLEKATS